MKKIRSLQQAVLSVIALSFSIFATSPAIGVSQTYPYAILTPTAPTQNDSVVMKLILGNNSSDCISPYLSSFRIIQTSNIKCTAPCLQYYLIKIGYAPDTRPTSRKPCPLYIGPYGPTYLFGVLNFGDYTVVDTTAGNDTVLSFFVNEKSNATSSLSGVVSGYGSCHYINNVPYCTGALMPVPGCSVIVTFHRPIIVPLAEPAAIVMPASLATVTDNSGHYSFQSIAVTYDNQPITVTAFKTNYNKKSASLSLITSPNATQNFNLESSYSNSNTIENNGIRYTIATDKADYKVTDSVFTRYTVENASAAAVTFSFGSGCQYDMNVVKPPLDTLYHYLKGKGCITMITEITLQPNQTVTMDFPGWKSDSAYDSLRVSGMLAGLTASAASIDIRFEQPVTGINFSAHAMAAPFKGAMIAFDRLANVLKLSVASAQSIQLNLYGLDGRKIAELFSREQCGPGVYRLSLNKFTAVKGCIIAKLKTPTSVSVVPVTILR